MLQLQSALAVTRMRAGPPIARWSRFMPAVPSPRGPRSSTPVSHATVVSMEPVADPQVQSRSATQRPQAVNRSVVVEPLPRRTVSRAPGDAAGQGLALFLTVVGAAVEELPQPETTTAAIATSGRSLTARSR